VVESGQRERTAPDFTTDGVDGGRRLRERWIDSALFVLLGQHDALSGVLKKVRPKNLEQALWFLDDGLLESTSNAVERRNRRHRNFQKTAYRVRTRRAIEGRIRHDCLRDKKSKSRQMALERAKRLFPATF